MWIIKDRFERIDRSKMYEPINMDLYEEGDIVELHWREHKDRCIVYMETEGCHKGKKMFQSIWNTEHIYCNEGKKTVKLVEIERSDDLYRIVRSRVAYARKVIGITKKKLAERLKIPVRVYETFEHDADYDINHEHLAEIADILGIKVNYLTVMSPYIERIRKTNTRVGGEDSNRC